MPDKVFEPDLPYWARIVRDEPIGYWSLGRLEETEGGIIALDLSGNGNHSDPFSTEEGKIQSDLSSLHSYEGASSLGLNLSRSGGGLEVSLGDYSWEGFTLEAWISIATQNDRNRYVIVVHDGSGNPLNVLAALAQSVDNKLRAFVGGAGRTARGSGWRLGWEVPTHIAVTWDESTKDMVFYVGGEAVEGVAVRAGTPLESFSDLRVSIGQWINSNPLHEWKGRLQDVAVFNKALSPEKIKSRVFVRDAASSKSDDVATFVMRARKKDNPSEIVFWKSIGSPDITAVKAPYPPEELKSVTVQAVVKP